MTAPQALIEFFQQEAIEYLDRLEQLLAASENACPDANAFLTHARALRGSSTMTRLEGLSDLAATVERIAAGLRDGELRWDQRLHFAVHGALVELRDLVTHANSWGESEQRRSRTQSVALAAVAAGYLAAPPTAAGPSTPVVPISRFFPDDGNPGVLDRNPNPPYTLAQRFRNDIAAAASIIERELSTLTAQEPGAPSNAQADGVRRALLSLSATAESYGATSISALAVTIARAPLDDAPERSALHALVQLLQDKARTDSELASRIKDATLGWPGRRTPSSTQSTARPLTPAGAHVARVTTPAPPRLVIRDLPATTVTPSHLPQLTSPAIIPIEALLYSGNGALERARQVRDQLRLAWTERVGVGVDPVASALLDELSDLLDLAVPV
ncbi:MAG: Hpt domain-containing protein [Gemmatimonadaceae bacterium]